MDYGVSQADRTSLMTVWLGDGMGRRRREGSGTERGPQHPAMQRKRMCDASAVPAQFHVSNGLDDVRLFADHTRAWIHPLPLR